MPTKRKTGRRKTGPRKTCRCKTCRRKTVPRKPCRCKTCQRKRGSRKTGSRKTGSRKTYRRQFGGEVAVPFVEYGGVGSQAQQAMAAGNAQQAQQVAFTQALRGGAAPLGSSEVPQFTSAGSGVNQSPINANTLSAQLNMTLQQAGANAELDGKMGAEYVQ